ncbi:MAG: metal ABC transporter substrate-binding protein, partial [Lachnospiraceae bacterium]|nr:metal ABC transporter substrate-binding protein [Lachnospiraceae bacterium]
QHVPYLNDFNKENGTHIVSVLEVHHEPMGVYSSKYDSFDVIKGN